MGNIGRMALVLMWFCAAGPLVLAQGTYDISRVAFWSSVGFDHSTTEMLFKRHPGQVVELNPIMGQNPWRRTAVGLGVAGGVDYATGWLKRKGHPRWAVVMNFALAGVHFGAGVHNLREIRR